VLSVTVWFAFCTQDAQIKRNKVPKDLRQPTGQVVGIIKRNWRQYCGILQKSAIKEVHAHLNGTVMQAL